MAKTIVQEFTKGLWDEIPPFRLVLGLCPVLAVTKTVENGWDAKLSHPTARFGYLYTLHRLRLIGPTKKLLVHFLPVLPGGHHCRQIFEPGAHQGTLDSLAQQLAPQRISFMIVLLKETP